MCFCPVIGRFFAARTLRGVEIILKLDRTAQAVTLAGELKLPKPVLDPLEAAAALLPWEALPIARLALPECAGGTWEIIETLVPSWREDDGMAQLAVTLAAAAETRTRYLRLGIPEEVFFTTMDCIPRFLRETRELMGRWVFDRGFWTWRQTAGLLFRLGALEFEVCTLEGACPPGLTRADPILSVHIPSDAALSRAELDHSYALASSFFSARSLCPWGPPKAVLCESWLLSPALDALLPENSGIRQFAGDYQRFFTDQEDDSFYRWLFHTLEANTDLPENTALQRRAKAFLEQGGSIGTAKGVLRCPLRFA